MAEGITKVERDSPDRCQAMMANGQCLNNKVEGTNFCQIHGGKKAATKIENERVKQYRLALLQKEIDEESKNGQIKSLHKEIVLARSLMQGHLNQIKTDTDLLSRTPIINSTIDKIEKLVRSCDFIESKMGNYLDKTQVNNLALEILDIISKHVEDPDILGAIGDAIMATIGEK